MKIYHNVYISLIIFIASIIIFAITLFEFELSKVSNDKKEKIIVIEKEVLIILQMNYIKKI